MPKIDSRIDDYIKKAQPFAQSILHHLRKVIHETIPDVEETIKWGMPSFEYKGPFCSFASFKKHLSFGFWKAPLMKDADLLKSNQKEGMGHCGRIESMKDLPPDSVIKKYLKEAKKLNDDDVKVPAAKKKIYDDPEIHPDFEKALKKNKPAWNFFRSASPSFKKEYNTWVNEAKRDETRNSRIESAVEWISEGKGRNTTCRSNADRFGSASRWHYAAPQTKTCQESSPG